MPFSIYEKIFIVIACVGLPILGYCYMNIVNKNVKLFIETKVIDRGRYKLKPIYGDEVIPVARSFQRAGKMFFGFSLVMSALSAFILYLYW